MSDNPILDQMKPPDPPEGWEGETHWPRPCHGHFHVTCMGHDLIGGKCDTEEEAAEKCRRLNAGEDADDVLGDTFTEIMKMLPGPADPATERERDDG